MIFKRVIIVIMVLLVAELIGGAFWVHNDFRDLHSDLSGLSSDLKGVSSDLNQTNSKLDELLNNFRDDQ